MLDTQDVTIGSTALLEQAHMTAHHYLLHANRCVDEMFGAEYCKRNPEFRARMLTAFLAACTADFNTQFTKLAAQDLRDALHTVADALREGRP